MNKLVTFSVRRGEKNPWDSNSVWDKECLRWPRWHELFKVNTNVLVKTKNLTLFEKKMPFSCFYSVIKARQKVGLTRNAHCRNTKARTSRNFYSFSVRGLIESRSKHFLSLLLFSDYLKKNTSRKGKGNTTSIWFSKCSFSALLFTFVGVEEFIYIF